MLFAQFERMQMYGAYLPGQDRKRVHLRCLIAAAKRHNEAGDMAMCIGDLNSGRNETDIEINLRSGRLLDWFSTADLYAELEREWTKPGHTGIRRSTSSVGIRTGATARRKAAAGGLTKPSSRRVFCRVFGWRSTITPSGSTGSRITRDFLLN